MRKASRPAGGFLVSAPKKSAALLKANELRCQMDRFSLVLAEQIKRLYDCCDSLSEDYAWEEYLNEADHWDVTFTDRAREIQRPMSRKYKEGGW